MYKDNVVFIVWRYIVWGRVYQLYTGSYYYGFFLFLNMNIRIVIAVWTTALTNR